MEETDKASTEKLCKVAFEDNTGERQVKPNQIRVSCIDTVGSDYEASKSRSAWPDVISLYKSQNITRKRLHCDLHKRKKQTKRRKKERLYFLAR